MVEAIVIAGAILMPQARGVETTIFHI